MICEDILKLTEYGMVTGLVPEEDERFTINRLLELFELEELDEDAVTAYQSRTPMSREEAEESIIIICCRLCILLIKALKFMNYFTWSWHQHSHDFRIK